jgi:hypothetical protein
MSTLQAAVMGVPTLFIVQENPVPFYLVLTVMVFVVCIAPLLLIFVPKIVLAKAFGRLDPREQQRSIRNSIRRSSMKRAHNRSGELSMDMSGMDNFYGEDSSMGGAMDSTGANSFHRSNNTTIPTSSEGTLEKSGARPVRIATRLSTSAAARANSMSIVPEDEVDTRCPECCSNASLRLRIGGGQVTSEVSTAESVPLSISGRLTSDEQQSDKE